MNRSQSSQLSKSHMNGVKVKLPIVPQKYKTVLNEINNTARLKQSQTTKPRINQIEYRQSQSHQNKDRKSFISDSSIFKQKINDSINQDVKSRNIDNVFLSYKSQQNIRQTLKNMNDNNFRNAHCNYLQRSFSQMHFNPQCHNQNDQYINNTNLNITYNNHGAMDSKNYVTPINDNQSSQKFKLLQEKRNHYFDSFTKFNFQNNNQFNYIQNNINLQNLFYNEIYQQYELMPDANQTIFNKYYEYELNNIKVIQTLMQECQNLQEQNTILLDSVEKLRSHSQDCEQKIKQNQEFDISSTFNTQIGSIKEQILFENQRLKKEIELLQDLIKQSDSNHIIEKCQKEIEDSKKQQQEQIKQYEHKLKNSDSLYAQQKLKIDLLKQKISQMNIEINTLSSEKQIMIFKLKEFENNYNAEDIIRLREAVLMQKEDLFLKDHHIQTIKKQYRKLDDKYVNLSIKYDRLVKQEAALNFEVKQNKSQKELLQEIRNEVSKDLQFQRCIYKETKDPNQDQIIKNLKLLKDFGNQIYEDNMKKAKGQIKYQMCVLAKPSFYLLLDDKLKKMDYKNVYEGKKYNWELFVTLRGIMDSKYNEFMLNHLNNDPVINISRFPEFVYSWLGSFSIDLQTRDVGVLDHRDVNPDEIRIQFLFELCHEKFSRIWEITLFKDFLSEKSEIDELYFLLTIRNMIFKGPQLSIQKNKYDYISYITSDRMEEVVKNTLRKYGIQQQDYVIEKVKEKAKMKGKVQMVDVYFLLSVLLEYYKNEKKLKCKIIKDLFLSYPNNSINQQFSISFDDFMIFMDENFTSLTELEKIQIYRDCWNLGGGKVGPEIFITVANERNLFIRHISLNKQFNFPITLNYDREIDPDNEKYEVLQTLYESVFNNADYFQKLDNYVEGLGNQYFLNVFQENYKLVLQKFQTNSHDLQDFNIFHIINRLLNKMLQIQNIQIMNQIYIENFDENKYVLIAKDFIDSMANQGREMAQAKKLNKIKTRLRLINFQKFSRKQINRFYANLLGLLNKYRLKKKVKS